MITRRGLAVIAASVALAIVGRIVGLRELYGIAGLGVGLVAAAFIVTRVHNPVRVTRTITPTRVHVDNAWRVELVAQNRGRRRSPLLAVSTTFSAGQRYARFALAPLAPNESVHAAFRLPSDKRGVFLLGPLLVERSDIFGKFEDESEKRGIGGAIAVPTEHVPRTGSGVIRAAWRPRRVLDRNFRDGYRAFITERASGKRAIYFDEGDRIVPLYWLVPSVDIEPELEFVDTAVKTVNRVWEREFVSAFDRATRTAR